MAVRAYDAITFDFWNTLLHEAPGQIRDRRLDAWMGILEDAGFACERERLGAVFESSWQRYVERWHANEQFQAFEAAEAILEELGFDAPDDVRAALHDAFEAAGRDTPLAPAPGIDECLPRLAEAGLRIGIVCDVGMTPSRFLRGHLERVGLLRWFDHWSFSDEVGAYKPDPAIFRHALDGLGVGDPARVAHVGDLRRTDIAGAQAMGMTAVRFTGVFDDPTDGPDGDHVIDDHRALPAIVGVAP
jgi:putative hydrolase of the HAD superfamily